MTRSDTEALVARLWPDGDRPDGLQTYAVIDAARDPRLHPMILATGLEHCCLFAGPLSPALQQAAPYLVRLSPTAKLTREFLRLGWGQSWGILAVAPPDVTLEMLRRHFRTLLRVRGEGDGMVLFRFYDPRVLRTYLPTCNEHEVARLLGPVRRLACESESGATVLEYGGDARATAPMAGEVAARHGAPTRIRNTQAAVFKERAARAFVDKLLPRLRRAFPQETIDRDDQDLARTVHQAVLKAATYGVLFETDVVRFVACFIHLGPSFDRDSLRPWAGAILSDERIDGKEKMDRMLFELASTKIHA